MNLNRMLRLTKILLSKIQSARTILLSGNQSETDLKLLQSKDGARNFPTEGLELSTGGLK